MKDIKNIMEKFGFSANEVAVYLSALKSGEATVTQISKTAKLNRVTVHHIINRFESKDLAVRFGAGKEKLVRVAHPLQLELKIKEAFDSFVKNVPKLVASMRDEKTKKPLVRMYYGVEGFKKAAEELLEKPNTTITHIGSLSEIHKFISVDYDKNYFIPTRIKRNIQYKSIFYAGEEKPVVQNSDTFELRSVKHIPNKYKILSSVFTVPGKVITVTTGKELMSVVTESEDISLSEIEKFNLIWDLL